MTHLVDPVLADLQTEYEHALRNGERWRSRWIWLAGHVGLLKAVLGHGALSTMRILGGASDDGRTLRRTLGYSVAVASLVSVAALVTGPWRDAVQDHPHPGTLALLLVPSVLPLALPAGLLFGIVWGMGRSRSSWRARAFVLLVAGAWSTASFLMLAWVAPETNQAYRVSVFEASAAGAVLKGPVPKGRNELTLSELRRFIAGEEAVTVLMPGSDARSLVLAYHERWALAATPVVLTLFALAVADRGWRRRLAVPFAGGGAIACYFVLEQFVRTAFATGPPAAIAWTPNLILLGSAFALWGLPSSNPADRPASA